MSTRRTVWVVGGVVAAVLVGVLAVGALATDRDGRGWGPPHHHLWGPSAEEVREARADLAADLGAELDVPTDAVEAAFRAVVAERLEDAAAAGRLEEADVEEALTAYDEGDIRGLVGLFKRGW